MKRITNYLIALAVMAFTFTSCEDVPSPYGTVVPPASGGETETVEAAGSGTLADPYNVQAVIEYVQSLGADVQSSDEVYIKGIVTAVTDISASYGNATFEISDTETGANKFTVYRAKGLNNESVTDEKFVKEGDVVVIYGKVVNYKGNTPETVQGSAYVYSVNGVGGGSGSETPGTGGDTPSGNDGTLEKPFTPAEANAFIAKMEADVESDADYYIKGKIIEITDNNQFNTQYGNCTFYISADGTDSSDKFYVFRTLYLGNVKYTEGVLPKAGDEVIICGKVVNYKGNTPETVASKSYIYSLNGTTETEKPAGDVTKEVSGTTITLTNGSVTASANTVTVDLNEQGWTNAQVVSTVELTDGTVITFSKGEGNNDPVFYDGTKGVRLYAKNSITITGASKGIAKVVLNCDSYNGTDYVGNELLGATVEGNTMTITNDHTSNSGGTQLRVQTITITYAE